MKKWILLLLITGLLLLPLLGMAEETCTHPETGTWTSVSPGAEPFYDAVDDKYHTMHAKGIKGVFCFVCGETLSETNVEDVEEQQWHDYKDGICTLCGHVNACTHPDMFDSYSYDPDKATYEPYDAKYHILHAPGSVYQFCSECGMRFNEKNVDDVNTQQPHSYENGVCTRCGFVNTCKHLNTHDSYSYADGKWEPLDAKYHVLHAPGSVYQYCDDCGERLNEVEVDDVNRQETHWFQNGVCQACGFVNTCTHPSTNTYYDFLENSTYKANNNRTHTESGAGYIVTSCAICYERLKEEKSDNLSETYNHNYDANGYCRQCGHQNTCTHPQKGVYTNIWDAVYTDDGNGVTHTATGTMHRVVECNICYMTFSDQTLKQRTSTETHYFVDGVCQGCGAKNTCPHKNTMETTWRNWDEPMEFKAIDNAYHSLTYKGYKAVYCSDCNETISKSDTAEIITDNDYLHNYVEGVCQDCGHVNTCTHAKTEQWRYITGVEYYSDITATSHTAHGTLYSYRRCVDCNTVLESRMTENSSLEQSHSYQREVCVNCGYINTCTHPTVEVKTGVYDGAYDGGETVYTPIDATYHSKTGYGYTYEQCAVCQETFNYVYPEKGQEFTATATAKHEMLDGKCLRCGYRNPMIGIQGFVRRCYNTLLGRDVDASGLETWSNELASGRSNAAEIISGLLTSVEYSNKSNSSTTTVELLYRTMLDREADPAGKADWVGVLDSTQSSGAVINGFCGSQEFLAICDEYGIQAGSVKTNPAPSGEGLEGFVNRCYSEALGRTSDAEGFANWCNILRSKQQTPQQVAHGFIFSPEMAAAEKIVSNPDALLDSLYRLYLGREPDPAGKDYWKQRIAEGLSLDDLNAGFANSAEFSEIVAGYGLN